MALSMCPWNDGGEVHRCHGVYSPTFAATATPPLLKCPDYRIREYNISGSLLFPAICGGSIPAGADPEGGGGPGGQDPPPPFWGTPKLHKQGGGGGKR